MKVLSIIEICTYKLNHTSRKLIPEILCRFRGLFISLPMLTIVKLFTPSSVGHRSAY
nr:MAG TPA: hypothetical protein [Caudoviricetes sp.]